MPTKNPRLNITFSQDEAELITSLAKQKRKSISYIAKELILEALERHEDMALSAIADAREEDAKKKAEKRISHKDAWK
ncbi:MAG: DUF6290 family protein [Candidatus Babeliales bacterium]|jgi:predicted DNA-binding protein